MTKQRFYCIIQKELDILENQCQLDILQDLETVEIITKEQKQKAIAWIKGEIDL